MQFLYLKHDLYRYFYPNDQRSSMGFLEKSKLVVFSQEIWAIVTYRFSRWVYFECRSNLIKYILKPLTASLGLFIQITTGIKIWVGAEIGPGFYIGHFGNVLIGPTKIGKFCNVSQEVSIGFAGRGENFGLPVVGDRVFIGAGAKILGKISIGNDVAIGANAVVTKDVPENAVVVGVPGRIISYDSSKDFINFNREKNKAIL